MGQSWFKFWASAREDSKLRSLSDFEFRYWVQLLCLSCASSGDGTLDISDREDVCIDIGLLDDKGEPCVGALDDILKKLARRKLIERNGEVVIFPSWQRRQGKPSDRPEAVRERVAKHRERQRNADVTPPVTPTEAEAEVEAEVESALPPIPRGNFPACMSKDKWVLGDSKPQSSRAHVLAAIEAKHGLVSTSDMGLLGAALKKRCPRDCAEKQSDECATFAISKITKAHTLRTAAKWIEEG